MVDPVKRLEKEFGLKIPKNPNKLTLNEIKEELRKIKDVENSTGFLYFLIAFVKVSHPALGAVSLREEMYNWQWNAALDYIKNKKIVSLKSRQVGYSTITGAYALWRALFFKAQEVGIVSIGQRESTSFLKRVKFIYDHLPKWMQAKTSEFAKTTISFADSSSSIVSLPNTKDPARGESLSLLIADEFGAFEHPKAFLAAATPATSAGMLIDFSNKSLPSQLFIISTLPSNPIDNEYLRILHNAQEDRESQYHLVDVTTDDIPHYQSEEWHKSQLEDLGSRLYKLEILKQEVYDIEDSLIPGSILALLEASEPIRVDFLRPEDVNEEGYYKDINTLVYMEDDFDSAYNYIRGLWIWEDPQPGVEYAVTVDVATGKAGDFSAIQIFRLDNLEQVAEFQGKPNLEQYKHIIEIITMYYNKAKLSIEKTGLGESIVSYFDDTLMYENLYYHRKSKHKVTPGFPMSTGTRGTAISVFASLMTKQEFIIHSIRTINEVRAFGYSKAGRVKGIGTNDDLAMALVQLAYLVHIGWAVSDNAVQQQLVFGQLIDIEEDEKEKAEKDEKMSKTLKYFQKNFDHIEFSDEDEEMMKMFEAMNVTVPIDMIIRKIENS